MVMVDGGRSVAKLETTHSARRRSFKDPQWTEIELQRHHNGRPPPTTADVSPKDQCFTFEFRTYPVLFIYNMKHLNYYVYLI